MFEKSKGAADAHRSVCWGHQYQTKDLMLLLQSPRSPWVHKEWETCKKQVRAAKKSVLELFQGQRELVFGQKGKACLGEKGNC